MSDARRTLLAVDRFPLVYTNTETTASNAAKETTASKTQSCVMSQNDSLVANDAKSATSQ